MRSLHILLIALALLPLSDALKCIDGGTIAGKAGPIIEKTCDVGIEFCMKMDTPTMKTIGYGCAPEAEDFPKCTKLGCNATTVNGVPTTMCCCKGNCEGAPKPGASIPSGNPADKPTDKSGANKTSSPAAAPTVLLPLAAAAAMIAVGI